MPSSAPEILSVTGDARAAAVARAAAILRDGDLVVIPTDTVYGLAAVPGHPAALQRLFAVKGRDADKPIPLLIDTPAAAARYGAVLSPLATRLALRFWPGALTLVLPVPTAPGGTEGFRVPACASALAVLRAAGGVLRVTSANRSGEPPARTAGEAAQALGDAVSLILDDGPAPLGVPSTVVRIGDGTFEVLRAGAISESELRAAAGGFFTDAASRPG